MQNNRKIDSKEAYFPKMESLDITILEPRNLLYWLTMTSTINVIMTSTINVILTMQCNYQDDSPNPNFSSKFSRQRHPGACFGQKLKLSLFKQETIDLVEYHI